MDIESLNPQITETGRDSPYDHLERAHAWYMASHPKDRVPYYDPRTLMRVIRAIVSVVVAAGILLVAAPFFLTWLAVDQRGIEIPGKVESKREYVRVRYSTWERVCEAVILYTPPDDPVSGSVTAKLDPTHFERLRAGQRATLRYLRREDLPRVPLAASLAEMRLLPVAKLPGQLGVDRGAVRVLLWIACGVIVLVAWRRLRLPGFYVAVAAGVVVLLAGILYSEFPRPTPEPRIGVRTATGRVAAVRRINRLFGGSRTRGMDAAQPIDVVSVEFTSAPGAEPVLAVDLLDAMPDDTWKVGAPAVVQYEAASPRTARLEAGTRRFAEINLQGAISAGALGLGVFLAIVALLALAGRVMKVSLRRLLVRRHRRMHA